MPGYYARIVKNTKDEGTQEVEVKKFTTITERDNWVTEFNVDKTAAVFDVETPPEEYILAQSYYQIEPKKQA